MCKWDEKLKRRVSLASYRLRNSNFNIFRYAPLAQYNATNGAINLGAHTDDEDDDEDEVFVNPQIV